MEFENGSLQEFVRCGPGATSDYIYQYETAILCGVWEFARGLTDMTTMPLYQVSSPLEYLCSNCGKDHASGQFPNCSAK